MRWVYDDIYGSGQRPITGIWATGENLTMGGKASQVAIF